MLLSIKEVNKLRNAYLGSMDNEDKYQSIGGELDQAIVKLDKELEQLWKDLGNVPCDEAEEIEEDFLDFKSGTNRQEIWEWFDENHSNGVHFLMFGEV